MKRGRVIARTAEDYFVFALVSNTGVIPGRRQRVARMRAR
jgi:hypothetical protein